MVGSELSVVSWCLLDARRCGSPVQVQDLHVSIFGLSGPQLFLVTDQV